MNRNYRTPAATLFVCVLLLAALGTWCAPHEALADRWLAFVPEATAHQNSDSSPFIAAEFFNRLMGVGSTPPNGIAATETSSQLLAPVSIREVTPGSEFFRDENGYSPHEFEFLPSLSPPSILETAIRGGCWGVSSQGASHKVGEYQDLSASAFWDIDQVLSNGIYALDINGTGLDGESSQSAFNFFTPKLSVDFRYRRFLHRLDHDPLTNMPPPLSGEEIVSEDLNVGEDYSVRIQDLKTRIKGTLSKSIKYRLNFALRRKTGERQALGTNHGAQSALDGRDCRTCHVLGQRQQIDWLTLRFEPVIEASAGPVTAEYSRPMRVFSENDDVVTRSYGDFHGYDFGGDYPYAIVPDTVSQTDRLKIGVRLPAETRFYSQMHRGDTFNRLRDTRRRFYGLDLRLTNCKSPQLTLNGFARLHYQRNQLPPFHVDPEAAAVAANTSVVPPYGLRHPIDYSRSSIGADAKWRPFRKSSLGRGLALNIGGEHGLIKREFAEYVVQNPAETIDQGGTHYSSFFVGTSMKWHPRFDTFVRYQGRYTSDPLYAVNLYTGETNTNLPEHQDVVQVGGTWVAVDNLIANISLGLENRRTDSPIADFEEDNIPMTFTLWYSPSPAWSLSGGYGQYTNWIDQQVYFPSDDPATAALDRRQWNYGGRAEVLSVGSSYACSESVSLSGGTEYVWASNAFDPFAPWPDLPFYSDVIVRTIRYRGGLDWCINDRVSAYARYIFQDYEDKSNSGNSGSSHMFLGGFSGAF